MENSFKVKEMIGGIEKYIFSEEKNIIYYKSVSNIIKFDYIKNKKEILIKTKSKILDFLFFEKKKKIILITNEEKNAIYIFDIKNKLLKKNKIFCLKNEIEKKERKIIFDDLNKIFILVKKMKNEIYNFEIYKFFEMEFEFLGCEKIEDFEIIKKIRFLKSELNKISLIIFTNENFSIFEINLNLKKKKNFFRRKKKN